MPELNDETQGVERLLQIMQLLRDPVSGCPWDREQSFETIAPYTIEEAYEVSDAIRREDRSDLREELGDLLFQVVYHARLAEEQGWFNFADVVAAISDKLVRRHPHVFGDEQIDNSRDQGLAWEKHKETERNRKSTGNVSQLDGIPLSFPALMRAEKLQKRAAQVGFDWHEIQGVLDKVLEEVDEVRQAYRQQDRVKVAEEVGDLLFTCANVARHAGVDSETVLGEANHKFEARFRYMEQGFKSKNRRLDEVDAEELDSAWEQAKRAVE